MDSRSQRRLGGNGYLELVGRRADLREKRSVGRRSPVRVAHIGTGCRVKRSRAVPDADAQDVLHDQTVHHVTGVRSQRIASPRGLQSDQTAARCRNPNGSAPVAGMRHRHDSRRDGRCRAAAGTARRALAIPRVPRRSECVRLGRPGQPEFGSVRLAHADQARPTMAPDDFAVVGSWTVPQQCAPIRCGHARVGRADIFQEERHARERALGNAVPGPLAGHFEHRRDDRVEIRGPLDRLDDCIDEFDRMHVPLAYQFREVEGVTV